MYTFIHILSLWCHLYCFTSRTMSWPMLWDRQLDLGLVTLENQVIEGETCQGSGSSCSVSYNEKAEAERRTSMSKISLFWVVWNSWLWKTHFAAGLERSVNKHVESMPSDFSAEPSNCRSTREPAHLLNRSSFREGEQYLDGHPRVSTYHAGRNRYEWHDTESIFVGKQSFLPSYACSSSWKERVAGFLKRFIATGLSCVIKSDMVDFSWTTKLWGLRHVLGVSVEDSVNQQQLCK